ncbi:MAG: hypothetical protein AB7O38_24320 [Pirellulaceae bacterium]
MRNPPSPVRVPHWPLRDEPGRSAALLSLVAAVSLGAGTITQQWMTALLLFGLLNLTLIRLWLPAEYEFSSKGIIRSCLGRRWRIAWSDIGRCEYRSDGVLVCAEGLSPSVARLHGIYIRWNGRRDELQAIIEYYRAQDGSSPSSATQAFVRPP